MIAAAGREWWNSITKAYPYLSIMHELYHAPRGHWENIYANNHLTGLGMPRPRLGGIACFDLRNQNQDTC